MVKRRLKVRKVEAKPVVKNPGPKLREYRVRVREQVFRVPAHSALEAKRIGVRAYLKHNPHPLGVTQSIPISENGQVVEIRTFKGRTQDEVNRHILEAARSDPRLRAALAALGKVVGVAG
jgi:hypothetical protein